MNRLLTILLGLIALTIIAYFCITKHSPLIEDDLALRAQRALAERDRSFAKVAIDGRELLLTGVASDEAARERAGEIARDINGVRTVKNQITLAQGEFVPEAGSIPAVSEPDPVEEEPATRSEPDPIPSFEIMESLPLDTQPAALFPSSPSPYRTDIVYENGKLVLSGLVADQSSRLWLVTKAKAQFGENNVEDQTQVAYGAPNGWHTTMGAALENLGNLDTGKVSLEDNDLTVTGFASLARVAEQVKAEFTSGISDRFNGSYDIKADEPEPIPSYEVREPQPLDGPPATRMPDPIKIQPVETCQQKFDALLADKRILFDRDRADIKSESHPLLGQLIGIMKECPDSSIEIAGHTDDQGLRAYNKKLSEVRAKAVVKYLRLHGVTSNKLHGVGYGELKPIADNSTKEGMAKNRRIEFNVQGN